jgi:hypothetical protein
VGWLAGLSGVSPFRALDRSASNETRAWQTAAVERWIAPIAVAPGLLLGVLFSRELS